MADLSITAASVVSSVNASIQRGTAGVTIAAGDVLYLDTSTQTLKLADNNGGSAGDPIRKVRGVAVNGAATGQPVDYVATDSDFTPGATLTAGVAYFLSATPGKMCPQADLATNNTSYFLGIATSATKLRLAPAEGAVLA